MNLGAVLRSVAVKRPAPSLWESRDVAALAYDSRKVEQGTLFFAFPGSKTDGRAYAVQALERGAVAVVSETPAPAEFPGMWIEVDHGRTALSLACRNFFGPAESLVRLVGITGTNGKTTTSYLMDSILRSAGHTTGLIGTIEYHIAGEVRKAVNTTPESLDLYLLFDDLARRGGTYLTMEVSSHALALHRVYGIAFEAAIFTNLTRDHLDFHHTMEEYFAAKNLLFQGSGASAPVHSLVNADDPWGLKIQAGEGSKLTTYGIENRYAGVRARNVSSTFDGLRFELSWLGNTLAIESPLVGRINVYNILAASSAALSMGIAPSTVAEGIRSCQAIPGRFERVDEGQPFLVVVDYAHTDDALRNTIQVARALGPQRIVTLFGCGGDRDRAKRPMMGAAAAELSDYVVLTSDNPRSEDPLMILTDALVGIRRFDTPHTVEVDRETAIRKAIEQAQPGDIVILAGKGHETYQVLRDRTIDFDDRETARRILRGFGYTPGRRK